MSGARSNDVHEDFYRPPRTIVICFDGTNGQYGTKNTNVVKFFGLLRKDSPDKQVAYYQAGLGTYFAPGVVSPLFTWCASLLDEAVAWYLDAHVMEGYKFLMNNYKTGDRICIFGFSRGAYTARALAGMLRKVGLLPKDNVQQINFAYKAYKRTDKEGVKLAAGFKRTFSQDVKIEFVGVWDTVQSTGVLISRTLPFTEDNDSIRVFRHALSLDERRARFRPNLYHWPAEDNDPNDLAYVEEEASRGWNAIKAAFDHLFKKKKPRVQPQQTARDGPSVNGAQQNGHNNEVTSDYTQPFVEFIAEESSTCTDVLEVWFAGCHSDVGGGNVDDDVNVSLAQIPLHWMVEHVIQAQCGILFDDDALARIGFAASALSPQPPANGVQASPGFDSNGASPVSPETKTTQGAKDIAAPELPNQTNQLTPIPDAYLEASDAIAPLFDELTIDKLWWILEVLPCSEAWQDKGVWNIKWSINLGRGRFIPYQKPKFHHTVKERMDYKPLKYKPRAIYDNDQVYV